MTDEFSAAYPKHQSSIAELKSLMTEQVCIAADVLFVSVVWLEDTLVTAEAGNVTDQ